MKRRKIKDIREELGTNVCIVGDIVKRRIKWTGHINEQREIT